LAGQLTQVQPNFRQRASAILAGQLAQFRFRKQEENAKNAKKKMQKMQEEN